MNEIKIETISIWIIYKNLFVSLVRVISTLKEPFNYAFTFKIYKHYSQPCTLHIKMYGLHSTPLTLTYNLVIITTHQDHWIVEAIGYIPRCCHAQL